MRGVRRVGRGSGRNAPEYSAVRGEAVQPYRKSKDACNIETGEVGVEGVTEGVTD